MIITYNNIEYYIPDFINQILTRDDLLVLPLKVWAEIFTKQFGNPNFVYLQSVLEKKILKYDLERNSFTYKENETWWGKEVRTSLNNLVNSMTDKVQIVIGENVYDFTKEELKNLLSSLELYANKVYVQTQKHLIAIKQLQTVDDLIKYDYTLGYPEKVVIE